VHLESQGNAARAGLAVSACAWLIWVVGFFWLGTRRKGPAPVVVETEAEGGS
jgi:hypothetical protein